MIKSIIEMIKESKNWVYQKHHWEFVWYDTFPDLDKGWIDFADFETLQLA